MSELKMAQRRALIAYAWHDVTCAEGEDCRDRELHSASSPVVNSGVVAAFIERLDDLLAEYRTKPSKLRRPLP